MLAKEAVVRVDNDDEQQESNEEDDDIIGDNFFICFALTLKRSCCFFKYIGENDPYIDIQ